MKAPLTPLTVTELIGLLRVLGPAWGDAPVYGANGQPVVDFTAVTTPVDSRVELVYGPRVSPMKH